MKKPRKRKLNVVLSLDTREALERMAERERRSLSSMIETLVMREAPEEFTPLKKDGQMRDSLAGENQT